MNMNIATAYWCVLVAAILPYVWVLIAKRSAPNFNNRNPRAWLAKQDGNYKVQRANAAHLNAFEAFAPFAAAVLMAQVAGVDPSQVALLALTFIGLRVLHGLFYLFDVPALRSLAWLGGFVCMAWLMVLAAKAIA